MPNMKPPFDAFRSSPVDTAEMPPGVVHIIGNEAAERFSFYGMKAVLAVFMVDYLHRLPGAGTTELHAAEAASRVHLFNAAVYLTPLLGALLADGWIGKYRTIFWLSLVYCAGHAALACMGLQGNPATWLALGLGLIALGSGGIKPCVSAHVGDQFSARNSHLMGRVFQAFYFAVNVGAFVSMLLTPWLLEWHGPHWAFGVPGVLMALATLVFWLGRWRFTHVPAGGRHFLRELISREGWPTLVKLLPLYAFVAMFWALFDQTGSTWIFQSEDMDLHFLGFEWLPSQIQSLNSVFVLLFIPLFAVFLYPWLDRVWKLTPLRKIGLGLWLVVAAFAMVACIQEWIDAGGRPGIGWQILAFALLTAAEVMVSIVSMEFAYTQSPRTMKSLVMCLYLGSVAVGNLAVAWVNHWIQIPSAAAIQLEQQTRRLPADWPGAPRTVVLCGYDGIPGNADDFIQRLDRGVPDALEIPGEPIYRDAARQVGQAVASSNGRWPDASRAKSLLAGLHDPWGNPLEFRILNSRTARISSIGPDRVRATQWDQGLILEIPPPPRSGLEKGAETTVSAPPWFAFLQPSTRWLDRQAGGATPAKPDVGGDPLPGGISVKAFSGGMTRLEGAPYFWWFTGLMGLTALCFLPYAWAYRYRTYLQQ